MHAGLIVLTGGRQNKIIDCQTANVRITVLPIMDVKIHYNSTLELHEHTYRLRNFTRKWLHNAKYCEYQPLFTTEDKRTNVKYLTEVFRPFRY